MFKNLSGLPKTLEMKKLSENNLFQDLAQIIEEGKNQLTKQVNSTITLVYWQVGKRINTDILNNERAEYSQEIVSTLSSQLKELYGKSFAEKNLRRMMQFAEIFKNFQIVVTLSRQSSWSHYITLIPIKNTETRDFYAQKAAEEQWSVRETRRQIERKAFERKEIAQIQLSESSTEMQTTFKDPYFLDFLGLKEGYLKIT
jgi:hypothetical protein